MKYYKELLDLQCFTRADVEDITGSEDIANWILQDYQNKGYVKSVKRNLYVAVSIETGQTMPNRYRIASNIAKDTYISHHSAFEYYGCANQVYYEVYVSGKKRFNTFTFEDINYRYFAPRIDIGINFQPDGVRITDIERTLLDSINDFEKIAGLEELLHCIELIPRIDEEKILNYLEQYNKQILYQKTGYILSHFKDELRISDKFYESCERKITKSIRYLYGGIEYESNTFDNRWQLYVPVHLLSAFSQGGLPDGNIQ